MFEKSLYCRVNKMDNDKKIEEMAENPKSALFKLAGPAFVSLVSIFFVSFMDSIWVSGLGNQAVTAVGLGGPVFYLLIFIGVGLGTSVNTTLSKSMAAKDVLESHSIVKNTIIIVVILSILIPLMLLPFLGEIIYIVGAGSCFNLCYDYLFILILFIGIFFISDIAPFFLRLQGYIKMPIYITVVTCILNIFLDPLFIYQFNLGIKGAAIATVLSVFASASLYLIILVRTKGKYVGIGDYHYNRERDFKVLKENLKIAGPIIGESILSLFFTIILNRFFVYEGLIYITAYTFAGKILSFITMPASAFSSSMLSISGFLIGSRSWEQIEKNFKYAFFVVEVVTLVPCLVCLFGSDFISFALYQTKDMVVINQISLSIKFLSAFYIFQVGGIMINTMFLSIGRPYKTLVLVIIGVVVDLVALDIMVYHLQIINSVYYVLLVASIAQIPICGYIFQKNLKDFLQTERLKAMDSNMEPS